MDTIKRLVLSTPVWFRKGFRDTVITLVPALIAINFTAPPETIWPLVVAAFVSAFAFAFIRNWQAAQSWLNDVLDTGDDAPPVITPPQGHP